MDRPKLWFGRSERVKMLYLWALAVVTTPTELFTVNDNLQYEFLVSPWEPILLLPLRMLTFAFNVLEFLIAFPSRPGVLLGNLVDVALWKVALFLNAVLIDPVLGVGYVLAPIIAAVLWVKIGVLAWEHLPNRPGEAAEPVD